MELIHDSNEASDFVVINTCGFIADAKQESIDTILQFAEAKNQGDIEKIFVMGCLSERYQEELQKEIPEVDGYYGVSDLPEIVKSLGVDYKSELLGERSITTPNHYAYLKIAEGCDRKCSFCAIPFIRGKHISKPIDRIVAEAEFLAGKGVKELILISQDLSYYGLDLYNRKALADLLNELVKIDQLEWIRPHYLYPTGFPLDFLKVMRDHEKICNYIDIPLQHTNDRILKSMRRGVGSKETRQLVDRIRKEVPDAAIRTAFIVGYPGETKKEFLELKDFIQSTRFERLGIFTYSPEEGTSAFALKDSISEEVKTERMEELMAVQEDISFQLNQEKTGKSYKVLLDRKEGDFYAGRTQYDSPEIDNEVLVKSEKRLTPGTFYDVKIHHAEAFDLFGEIH